MPAAVYIINIRLRQAGAGDGVDKEHGIPGHTARPAQAVEGLQRLGKGEALDLVQCPLLPRQLHDGGRGAQGGQVGAHQRLVGNYPAAACREDGLEAVEHLRIAEQLPELPAGALGVGFAVVHPDVELLHPALLRMLDLIHGKVGVFF